LNKNQTDLRRIQDSIQDPPPGALRLKAGAFAVTVHPDNPLPWFNDAVPEAEPTDADVQEMIEVFRRYGRRPRLEFLKELWPTVPGLLEKHGFRLKDTQPALVTTQPSSGPPPAGIQVRLAIADDAKAIDEIGNIAFEGDGPDPLREAAIRDSIVTGRSTAAIAYVDPSPAEASGRVATHDGKIAIGSGRIVGAPAVKEVVSVGTLPAFRRRGVASAVVAELLNEFFARGGEVAWLTATPEADNVYRRLGFVPIANQVCYLLD
jgi:GNAT superfamily N-acetyltransferase